MIWNAISRLFRPSDEREGVAPPGPARAQDRFARTLDRLRLMRGYHPLVICRGAEAVVLLASEEADIFPLLGGKSVSSLRSMVKGGDIRQLWLQRLRPDGRLTRRVRRNDLLPRLSEALDALAATLEAKRPAADRDPTAGLGGETAFLAYLRHLRSSPTLIDFLNLGFRQRQLEATEGSDPPVSIFDDTYALPALTPAQPRRRSALFLNNSYYHYKFLAEGLRKRGWDAMTVSLESPDSPHQQFYHGEDLNLFNPDPEIMRRQTLAFFASVPERFGVMHFYGQGMASFFGENMNGDGRPVALPWDFMELRRHRMTIGYMASGCVDGGTQTSIRALSGGVCSRCIRELHPETCNDQASLLWARQLEAMCDWIGLENDWATRERMGPQYVRYPVITALDSHLWRPGIAPPDQLRIDRQPGEVLVYHAVGNYTTRRQSGRDIKGTGAIIEAIDRLRAEGVPVRLVFATDVPSREVRYLQVQADIVVDQLNYGRLGANARESMMLGKPVVVKVDPRQTWPLPDLDYITQAPVINATEQTIYATLKGLLDAPDSWSQIGHKARAFALKWHAALACAARFENVIDRLEAGLPPENPDFVGVEPWSSGGSVQ